MRLLDRKRHDARVRRVAADERDVGSMQRGQHARRRRHAVGRQNLACQIGRSGVRHGVVRVHDVEPMVARQTDEGGGERKQVLRLAEQRICWRLDPLEREAWNARPPSERLVAADQVDLVAAARELAAQLGGHDAAAAEVRVAADADLELAPGRAAALRRTLRP